MNNFRSNRKTRRVFAGDYYQVLFVAPYLWCLSESACAIAASSSDTHRGPRPSDIACIKTHVTHRERRAIVRIDQLENEIIKKNAHRWIRTIDLPRSKPAVPAIERLVLGLSRVGCDTTTPCEHLYVLYISESKYILLKTLLIKIYPAECRFYFADMITLLAKPPQSTMSAPTTTTPNAVNQCG
jgi:hypothetical protein